jgi:hypothetical protein
LYLSKTKRMNKNGGFLLSVEERSLLSVEERVLLSRWKKGVFSRWKKGFFSLGGRKGSSLGHMTRRVLFVYILYIFVFEWFYVLSIKLIGFGIDIGLVFDKYKE